MPFNRVISAGIIAFAVTACGSSSSTSTQTDPSGEGSGTLPDDRDSAKLGCGWVLQSDPAILNVAFPDASATYWVAVVPNVPGTRLRIDGQYPDARYFSFNAYDPALRPIDGIADARIAPDAGSGNPFSDEGATSGGHYSLTVEFGKKPEVPAQNTLYSGSITVNGALALPNPVTVLLYRIYIPASGLPLSADVPLPTLTLETAAGDVLVPSQAGCSEPVLGTVVNQLAQVDINGALLRVDYPDQLSFVPLRFPTATYPPVTGVFYGLPNTLLQILNHASPVELPGVLQGTELLSGGGFLSNSDAAYSTSAFSRSDGNIFILRARAPSWRGAIGVPFGSEDMRYWSVCENEFATQRYVACSADEDTMIDSLGFFTVVVSDAADRPINAVRTNDITWLPWGPYPDGLLLYRHLLPNPAFAQAIQNVPYGSDPDAVMGDYFPQVAYCTRATAEAAGSQARDVFNACLSETLSRR